MLVRVVLVGLLGGMGAVYGAGAFHFWVAEHRSQSLEAARSALPSELRHPEATLALIRDGMERDDFSPRVGELIERALGQLPAFYQPRVYEALYHANRLEEPVLTRDAFEAALERFPANGRLHLDYARWLLRAPSMFPGVPDGQADAEAHITTALGVEPNLTQEALDTLARYEVSAERWSNLVPDELDARRRLVLALARGGHRDQALDQLAPLLARTVDPRYLREAAYWALGWGDPALALEAVEKWKHAAKPSGEAHEPGLVAARAHLALGEMDAAYDVFRSTLEAVGPSSSAGLKLLCGIAEEYYRLRRLVLAESIFTEATGYSPSYVRALLGLARVRLRLGDEVEAIEYYQKILQLDPDNAAATNELGNLIVQRRLRGRG